MKKRLTCLTAIFLTQLAGEIGLSQSVQARPYPESEAIPKLDVYLKGEAELISQVSEVLGACWTLGATNPKGWDQSAKWADAHNQLRKNFRRDMNLRPYPVTGYCKGHTKGFKFRTADVATNRKPGSSVQSQAISYLNDQRFICATAPFSAEACLTRREWLSILLNWGSGDTTVSMQIPNYGTYTKTIRAWASILKTHSFSSAKTNRSRVPIRASWSENNESGIGITEADRPINWFAD